MPCYPLVLNNHRPGFPNLSQLHFSNSKSLPCSWPLHRLFLWCASITGAYFFHSSLGYFSLSILWFPHVFPPWDLILRQHFAEQSLNLSLSEAHFHVLFHGEFCSRILSTSFQQQSKLRDSAHPSFTDGSASAARNAISQNEQEARCPSVCTWRRNPLGWSLGCHGASEEFPAAACIDAFNNEVLGASTVLGTRARMGGRRYLVLTELLVPWGTQTNKQANNNCRLQWVLWRHQVAEMEKNELSVCGGGASSARMEVMFTLEAHRRCSSEESRVI